MALFALGGAALLLSGLLIGWLDSGDGTQVVLNALGGLRVPAGVAGLVICVGAVYAALSVALVTRRP